MAQPLFRWALILLLIVITPVQAQNILTVRSALRFENSMPTLKSSIEAHGYTVSHVQRCDSGLQGYGYVTDRYRVVFFGKLDEVRQLSEQHPELIPFLPLKIALFAEGEHTIISSINPSSLGDYYPSNELRVQFRRWENDLRSILRELQSSGSQVPGPHPAIRTGSAAAQ